jgi:hypothetical protein
MAVRRWVAEGVVVLLAIALVAWAIRADDTWIGVHLSSRYCEVEEWSLTTWRVVRAGAPVVALVLVVWVRPRLARWLLKLSLKNTIPTLIAVILSLSVTEAILRVRKARTERADTTPRYTFTSEGGA